MSNSQCKQTQVNVTKPYIFGYPATIAYTFSTDTPFKSVRAVLSVTASMIGKKLLTVRQDPCKGSNKCPILPGFEYTALFPPIEVPSPKDCTLADGRLGNSLLKKLRGGKSGVERRLR